MDPWNCLPLILVTILASLASKWILDRRRLTKNIPYYHVLITGGSSGIGKATAKEVLKRGAKLVTLWARNMKKLEEAREEIMRECSGNVNIFSVDVIGDIKGIQGAFEETLQKGGDVRMVIHCAGSSMAGTLEDTPIDEYERMMRLNYFGTVNVVKAVLPHLKKENSFPSRLTLISSIAGVMGLYGYTAYSASKFALRGFAESLAMEVRPHGITLTLNLPPDTDTPSFEEENKSKPLETALLSETGGLFQPEKVAEGIINDTLNGVFLSSVGLDGWLVRCICFGMSSVGFGTMVLQALAVGPLRVVAWGYTLYFEYIVKRCFDQKRVAQL